MGRKRKVKILESVAISGLADKGRGVGQAPDGRVVFVDQVAPGDVVDVRVQKKRKKFFQGIAIHFHHKSEQRTSPFCEHFELCGGCKYQHIQYEVQAQEKEKRVRDALERIGKIDIEVFHPILKAPDTRYYRNKLEFSFSSKRWLTREEIDSEISNEQDVLGFHKAGAFDKIIDIQHCYLQPEPSNTIRNAMREIGHEQGLSFYDARNHRGFLRNVVIRTSSTGQTMVIVAFGSPDAALREPFLQALLERVPQIHALYFCINEKVNDFLLDLPMVHYHGAPYIEERLQHLRFQIGPKSFFQTNTKQAAALFEQVADFADLKGTETVYDLYTGIGSIALFLANSCRQVVGIEEVEAAIEDAEINRRLNQIENAKFYAGDVKDILHPGFVTEHGAPDLVVTDPPRAGMHPKVIEILRQLAAPKIVYVSCNPATQARDLQLLSDQYRVRKVRPVDMFPHTHHIENVALLEKKG